MSNAVQTFAIGTFVPVLRTLSTLLDKAAAHAAAKGIDPAELLAARLAPDMMPLSGQVQLASDYSKNSTARIIGQTPPSFPDDEKTIDELKARIAKTIDYLESIPAAAFEGAETRAVTMKLMGTLVLEQTGLDHLRAWALPNFYFHVATAYGVMRSQGVEIGKRDFMADLAGPSIHDAAPAMEPAGA
ncbi:MAG: DUF1993 domain-containing protein [Caulobacteraceae bacterium]